MHEVGGYDMHDSWEYYGRDTVGAMFGGRRFRLNQYSDHWWLFSDRVNYRLSELQGRLLLMMPADEVYEKYFGRGR